MISLTISFRILLSAWTAIAAAHSGIACSQTVSETTPGRALALDCRHLPASADLKALPAPRVIGLSGTVPIYTMQGFSEFLVLMGYPETALRDPYDGALDVSGHTSSAELAGTVAWYYENDGMRPMLVGHSGGGMLVVRTLHELNGEFADAVAVFDPVERRTLPRTSIVDPETRERRPVVGLSTAFSAALATGTLPRLFLGQWSMLTRLRRIPDTAAEFTGYTIAWDPIAGNAGTATEYEATGTARVRNVLLPASYSHIGLPRMAHLAANPVMRAWIDAYTQEEPVPPLPADSAGDASNLLLAADLWSSIRRHWCFEGQRRLAAKGSG